MAESKHRNLLFVMTDHQRADSIGMAQSGVEVTPNLSKLAAAGTVFTRAYSACPLCVPARTALATGTYPTRNGVVINDWDGATAQDHKPLHQFLYEAGYEIGHIGVHHVRVRPSIEERVPFSKWVGVEEYKAYLGQQGLDESREDVMSFQKPVVENQGGELVDTRYSNAKTAVWSYDAEHFQDLYWCHEAADFLKQDRDKPFALFLYLWAPHPPLRVPEPYASKFDPAKIDLPENVGRPAQGEPANRRKGVAGQLGEGLTEKEWRKAWAAHLGLTNLADAGIGQVFEALNDSEQADNTIILFTVDHGDHMGQHCMYQKMEMYEQALRIPLIVRGPGILTRSIDTPVSHLDVMPTILDLLGMEPLKNLDGDSLAAALKTNSPVRDKPVFAQYTGNTKTGDIRRCVVTKRFKYVFDPVDAPELYDLEEDPLEMKNIAAGAEYAGVVKELHSKCESWGRERNDWAFD